MLGVILFMSLLFLINSFNNYLRVGFGPIQPNQLGPLVGRLSPHIMRGGALVRVRSSLVFSLRTISCVSLVKHPSGDGDAIYQIKIAADVLVFIKDCRALV